MEEKRQTAFNVNNSQYQPPKKKTNNFLNQNLWKATKKTKCFIGLNLVHCFLVSKHHASIVLHVAPHVFRQLLEEQHRHNCGADLSPGSLKHLKIHCWPLADIEAAAFPTCFTDCCSAKKVVQLLQRHLTASRFGLVWSWRRCCVRCSLTPYIREQFCHWIRWARSGKQVV